MFITIIKIMRAITRIKIGKKVAGLKVNLLITVVTAFSRNDSRIQSLLKSNHCKLLQSLKERVYKNKKLKRA